jgi:acetyl-CoA carboxylase biotin carboxyl carrier protein
MKRPGRADNDDGESGHGAPAVSGRIDAGLVRALAEVVDEYELSEIEVEDGDLRIRVTRHFAPRTMQTMASAAPATMVAPLTATAVPSEAASPAIDPAGLVKSPMVGTVYRRSNPESKAFVEIGSAVKTGDRVLLIEAMKTFNDVVATRSGTVTEILVEDGQPVEYGEPLLIIT